MLSARQREVLDLVSLGLTNKEIAGRLFVGVKTVEKHIQESMDRLDIHNRVLLARYVWEQDHA